MKTYERFSEINKKRTTEKLMVSFYSEEKFYKGLLERKDFVVDALPNWRFDEKSSTLEYFKNGKDIIINLDKGRAFIITMNGAYMSFTENNIRSIAIEQDKIIIRVNEVILTLGNV